MKRLLAFLIFIVAIPIVMIALIRLPFHISLIALCVFFGAIAIYDVTQTKHAVLRNFPIAGHLRYIFEFIRPEIQQYFVATDQSERPFNHEIRSLVYQRAKGDIDTLPFGTQHDVHAVGYQWLENPLAPAPVLKQEDRVMIGGAQCARPYAASRFNISGMSFGALSQNAVIALNRGAKIGGFYHSTGEGGLSEYHRQGGDLVWQIGTAYFSCRTPDGHFDEQSFIEKSNYPEVKMIEVKLSQGAKPSHGGILPAAKITPEIAAIRGIPLGQDCVSPAAHTAFSTPIGLLEFIQRLRNLSGGKPTGFKFCLGQPRQFMAIAKAMLETKIYPDFITVDGAEGGTGAAPVEFCDFMGTPLQDALNFVNNCLVGPNLRDKVKLIASGKVATGFDLLTKLALGADACNCARGMMFALGCIQSLQCNQNTCPTGVATQDPRLMNGLVPSDKAARVANFHAKTLHSFHELIAAMGFGSPSEISPHAIRQRVSATQVMTYADIYPRIPVGSLLALDAASISSDNVVVPFIYLDAWKHAHASSF